MAAGAADGGVPVMTAIPFPLSVKDSPAGRAPDSVKAGAGYPVGLTVRSSGAPTVALVYGIFLIVGALVTVRVNAWLASRTCSWRSGSTDIPRQLR
jgi:hypothetical protein